MNFFKLILLAALIFTFVSCEKLQGKPGVDFLGPVLEVVGEEGKLGYTGKVINNSDQKLKNVLVRYIGKDKDGRIIEAITIPLIGSKGLVILKDEIVDFQFMLRSETKNVFSKQLTLDYVE